ncbi:MAG: AsmA-like C-terminal region-containing protein, partial [Rhodocyclaceae bacterium]
DKGSVYGTRLGATTAEIADLDADDPLLTVKGSASGPTKDFLRFIATSPVAEAMGHFTDGMTASGDGSLQLALGIPLNHPENTRLRGNFDLAGNSLTVDAGLPALAGVNGQIQFTESGLSIRQAGARLFGAPLGISAETRDGTVAIALRGRIAAADLRHQFDSPLLEHLSGATDWRGNVEVRAGKAALRIDSDLQGVASSLPEPFNKTAAEALPLHVERTALAERPGGRGPARDQLRISLGRTLSVSLVRRSEGGKTVVETGAVGVNDVPETASARGVSATAKFQSLDLDAWRRLVGGGGGEAPLLPFAAVNLRADQVTAFGQQLGAFSMTATREGDQWIARVASKELTGRLEWQEQGKGRLRARLSQLALSELESAPTATDLDRGRGEGDVKELPGLDVVADAFTLRGKPLGRLELRAANRASVWRIEHLGLHNSDGTLQASGQWRAGKASGTTQLEFRLDAKDAGKLLERLGYGNAVKRGTAVLEGKVDWNGAPTRIDLASLDGRMTLQAGSGQFAKLEPGVGRLLGIVSLQALPRRITLDFRDVFSEGFAFDNISGSIAMKHGTMETQDLQIQGPAARVKMVGSANLTKETQHLRVFVQPTLSESVALGAAVFNPLVGLAAYVAQKAF